MMKKITAKFKSTCADTGATIKKGDMMYYNYSTKKCYCLTSTTAKDQEKKEEENNEADSIRGYINAQENAYCDNRYYSMR